MKRTRAMWGKGMIRDTGVVALAHSRKQMHVHMHTNVETHMQATPPTLLLSIALAWGGCGDRSRADGGRARAPRDSGVVIVDASNFRDVVLSDVVSDRPADAASSDVVDPRVRDAGPPPSEQDCVRAGLDAPAGMRVALVRAVLPSGESLTQRLDAQPQLPPFGVWYGPADTEAPSTRVGAGFCIRVPNGGGAVRVTPRIVGYRATTVTLAFPATGGRYVQSLRLTMSDTSPSAFMLARNGVDVTRYPTAGPNLAARQAVYVRSMARWVADTPSVDPTELRQLTAAGAMPVSAQHTLDAEILRRLRETHPNAVPTPPGPQRPNGGGRIHRDLLDDLSRPGRLPDRDRSWLQGLRAPERAPP